MRSRSRSAALIALIALGCQPAAGDDAPARPNVILVALDTVRWDHTSLSGYARDTTPNLARLAEMPGSTTFTRAYAAASWSLPAYASIFTGRSALGHGVGFTRPTLDTSHRTLAEILKIYGYSTQGWASSAHLHPDLGLSQGFDGYEHSLPILPLTPQVTRALSWLDTREQGDPPFFLFVQGYDAHMPYAAPAAFVNLFEEPGRYCSATRCRSACGDSQSDGAWRCFGLADGDQNSGQKPSFDHIISHYDAALYNADYQLGRLLHGLSQRGLLDSSIVIALGDHGEGLGEVADTFGHDGECGNSVFRVPLVVHLPGGADPARFEGVVSLDGLLPTLLEHLQIPPLGDIDGTSFLSALQRPLPDPDPAAYARSASKRCYAVTDRDWQAAGLFGRNTGITWGLWRGGVGADVSAEHPGELARLRAPVAGWPESLDTESINQQPGLSSPQIRESLQRDGYWTLPERPR